MNEILPFVVIGLVSGSVYGLAGVGLVVTYRTSGVFNFAHGVVAAVAAYLFYQLWVTNGLPWPVALVLCVFVLGPLAGMLLERIARTLTNAPVVSRVVATLGIVVAVQQLLVIYFGAVTLQLPPFLPTANIRVFDVNIGVDQLIVMAVALVGTAGLSLVLRFTRLGLQMRGVVDNTDLLGLTGGSPRRIRVWSWCIGSTFGCLSGIMLAPTIGVDAFILTLLVVSAFGAAALGLFRSLPLTYVGGLALGVGGALATKYVGSVEFLSGLPPTLPFVVLFAVLVFAPRRKLVEVSAERRLPVIGGSSLPAPARRALVAVGVIVLALVPHLVGTQLVLYTTGLVYVIVFLSLIVLERFSGQLSLAQLAFVAVGGAGMSHLAAGAGLPWLVAALAGAFIAVPIGALLAIPAIRLSGLYLALATLGFGMVMESMVYGTRLMFGNGIASLPAPRPSFAQGDTAYYYVVLLFVIGAAVLVVSVRRSRLGRLLRAMADSPVALATHGMNVTVVKVMAFCISAFLAGLAGAVLGPVTGQLSAISFGVFPSLMLVVVLALQRPLPDIPAAFVAAASLTVIPSYLDSEALNQWLPVLFGMAAVAVAMTGNGGGEPPTRPAGDTERLTRSVARQRMADARARLAAGAEI